MGLRWSIAGAEGPDGSFFFDPSILEKLGTHRVTDTVQLRRIQIVKGIGFAAVLFTLASSVCVAAPAAAVSGIVRDSQGVAQMGAMVQVFAAGSASVGTAFTDLYGRYKIANLVPGRYQIKATAALYVPAMRANLFLATGARATVNLTLTMLSDPAAWIPAERRKPDEPGDDWTWTLRSAANRPILRMMDNGEVVLVSSSAAEGTRPTSSVAREAMMSGDGGFGGGGAHNVFSLDRVTTDGSDVVLRTDFATARTPYGRGPSMDLDAGYERRVAFAGASRMVVSYTSHPELMNADGTLGVQMSRMANAQKMRLGDMADIEAGGTVYAVHTTGGYALASQPFLRVTVHPGTVWAVKYRMATSRDLQGFDGLDTVESAVPMAAVTNGKLSTESGRHQEIGVSRKFGKGVVQAAIYQDTINRSVIAGTGVMGAADMLPGGGSSSVVVDTVTDNFQFLSKGYTTRGVSLMVSQPLTSSLWAAFEYQNGAGLSTQSAIAVSLPELSAGLHAQQAEAVTAALKGQVLRSGTKLRAAYRWQPRRMLTPVGSYEAFSDQAFLGLYVRQSVHCGSFLPPGLEATVDVTNLLAEGYQPFLSADGRTLFLAQSPRTIQGGLSFTF
jgi:Carboxypeptidase regulatory-like domain